MNISLSGSENIESIAKDEVLFKEGELPDCFFIIISGKVTCLKWYNDRLVPIYTAGEQEIVGEDCVLADTSEYFYSAVVMEDCEVIRIEKSEVFKFLNTQSDWIKNILRNISEKLYHTSDLIAEHRILDKKLLSDVDFSDDQEALFRKKL